MRPQLLEIGGFGKFAEYEERFNAEYRSEVFTDVFGNHVIFPPISCRHVCYTEPPEQKGRPNTGRTVWQQKRADRILWISAALKTPKRIRPGYGDAWVYMLEVRADLERKLAPELYVVIAKKINSTAHMPEGRIGTVHFSTAYTVLLNKWDELGRTYPFIYPVYKPRSDKKK